MGSCVGSTVSETAISCGSARNTERSAVNRKLSEVTGMKCAERGWIKVQDAKPASTMTGAVSSTYLVDHGFKWTGDRFRSGRVNRRKRARRAAGS